MTRRLIPSLIVVLACGCSSRSGAEKLPIGTVVEVFSDAGKAVPIKETPKKIYLVLPGAKVIIVGDEEENESGKAVTVLARKSDTMGGVEDDEVVGQVDRMSVRRPR